MSLKDRIEKLEQVHQTESGVTFALVFHENQRQTVSQADIDRAEAIFEEKYRAALDAAEGPGTVPMIEFRNGIATTTIKGEENEIYRYTPVDEGQAEVIGRRDSKSVPFQIGKGYI